MKKPCLLIFIAFLQLQITAQQQMHLNSQDYLQCQGVNVMLAQDFYPEGHQGGVGIIQHGQRVATNGDIRLEPTPGQWQPIPAVGRKSIDRAAGSISVHMSFPDESINRKGFNPIIYPDLHFSYTTTIVPSGKGFRITVDLDSALPEAWVEKVGFNLELFPGALFGKTYYMGSQSGIFPKQANGPHYTDGEGQTQITPMASGNTLTIAPESEAQTMTIENLNGNGMQLLDGRGKYNNGWFVVRALVKRGLTRRAIEWMVTPHAIAGWISKPVVQVSQVGYHPRQTKIAVIELDRSDRLRPLATLLRIRENGGFETVLQAAPRDWGLFLRYHYLQFDFSAIKREGMYIIRYGSGQTAPFRISDSVFTRGVWQPTLEYFLPVQMCHMRVNDKYRVWHGYCHLDDARMAPIDSNHFDGYIQGPSTLTAYRSGQTIPGLNRGAWHDAGDFDIRVESQSETVYGLTLAYEAFGTDYDNTAINQHTRITEIQQPDGKPDILQQIEHGLLSLVGGYKSMGRFYRGIIEPTLRQYTLLGDAANSTDNVFYQPAASANGGLPPDDRWVFTEDNPGRALEVASALAAASRVMKGFNDTLAHDCLAIAGEVWERTREKDPSQRLTLAAEMLLTTKEKKFADFLVSNQQAIDDNIAASGWVLGRVLPLIKDAGFLQRVTRSVRRLNETIEAQGRMTPYGVPYRPNIWGAGWDIQHFGYKQYFLHTGFPDIVSDRYMFAAMNFILGCHPGSNTASFASGVGAHSLIPGYGFNRADWSYIPGGVGSGTALIRPDFPELLSFPYLWQQAEYVLGGGTTDYLFLVLAADHLLQDK